MGKIEDAVKWAKDIVNDDSHGYDQDDRWGPDYDCSSFVISAWEAAGVGVKANGASNTRDMCDAFIKTGFSDVKDQITLSTDAGLVAGDVLWKSGHTCMYVGDGKVANASENENGNATGGKTGDQNGKEIVVKNYYNSKWTKVLRLSPILYPPHIIYFTSSKSNYIICFNLDFVYGITQLLICLLHFITSFYIIHFSW